MISFIKTVLVDLNEKGSKLEDLHFILPSKRAGVFLKHQLSTVLENPIFSPQILSIEEFVEDLSGLQKLSNADLLFRFYDSYQTLTPKKSQESFESFSKWAQMLLQDFNEIDRFLVPQEHIFDYLHAIKELNHWSLEGEQTDLIKKHLKFWGRLKEYYLRFTEHLLQSKEGYQGLIYREAADNLEAYIESNSDKHHIFLGFNALNTSESQIIQGLLQSDLAEIYWDIDEIFIDDDIHNAGLFTRAHRNRWNYFKKQPFNWVTSHYSKSKNIQVVGIPKLVGQAKYIGQLLGNISLHNKDLKSVAIVLGEEDLLMPVLNSIPKSITHLNITMGLPLNLVPLASLFEKLFSIHRHDTDKFYFKDVIDVISHPSVYNLFKTSQGNSSSTIVEYIQKNNLVYVTAEEIKRITKTSNELIELLFKSWGDNPKVALTNCLNLILGIKRHLSENKSFNRLELEYLYRFNSLFNQLLELNENYSYLSSIASTYSIYKELLSVETLDFKGEPLEGLQVMGMLESRVLDFETVIISSVNEGILPSGKTNNSFIPFDVKVENNLPTFKEKDAVYAYHFFRLLQRAKNVYILYNTEVDALKGGEKSRFITQLEIEGIHNIKQFIISQEVPVIENKLQYISKTETVLDKLKELSTKGFSPSSLSNYIRNPIDFYYEKILGIKDFEAVEENIAANTLGSVIHNTLEDFYKPLEDNLLTLEHLNTFKSEIEKTVTKHFKSLYKDGDFTRGKNLIIFEIAQRYISNFLNSEIESLNSGNEIKIITIEGDTTIELKIEDLDYNVKITGKVDRVDQLNGVTRVIDYKSGKVEQNKVELVNWEDLTTDYNKYSKSFQVLCYAYMMYQKRQINLPVEAGIISFKNLNAGFLKFGKKPSAFSRTKEQLITEEMLNNFEVQLKKLILEICNPNIDFIEKEIE
ncbi:PD-(D/E)XK nuclease family protein [Winogradskyella luteola]|uniref:PD-(D/E)XK nuclease family protein n=1 Tax=Winogradskyella luteola TaxID=2828330 RepID=A0A9X1FB21_9FLAO|nr:PD-(D/E)XK nuclease family protein [Winogradskyella luteola]MBV7269703.1 PD-(D/E)XK nuclease family protein [Winogradskyella luteola]